MGSTKEETGKGKEKGKKGWDSSLRPGDEPSNTHNRTKAGHRTDLNIPHQTALGYN